MNGKMILLKRSIEKDLEALEHLFALLEETALPEEPPEEMLIVLGYRLHNLYNAFENIFRAVAQAFEGLPSAEEAWHQRLLEQMSMDLSPLRPAVINAEMLDGLDELRRFRHLFRHAYTLKLDPERLRLVLRKAEQVGKHYRASLEAFLAFLDRLIESP